MTLDDIADELYGLPPADFVTVRNARAKQAKAAGDKELSAAITALGKPTKVAWLANQLVRQHRQDVQPLMELGAGLREATATLSGEDLRRLTKQQHQLVHALVQQAKGLAGGPVTEDVADGVDRTLRAALADSSLADQLLLGRLTEGLEFSGFGGSAAGNAAAPRPTLRVVQPLAKPDDGAAAAAAAAAARREATAQAEQALSVARTAVSAAESARDSAASVLAEAEAGLAGAEQRLDRLHGELDQAKTDKEAADKDLRTARNAADVADRAVRGAARRAASAASALTGLRAQD